jgi:hypothetical protein
MVREEALARPQHDLEAHTYSNASSVHLLAPCSTELYSFAGFKSFARLQRVGPLADFTCIVGPNGSGKSAMVCPREAGNIAASDESGVLSCTSLLVLSGRQTSPAVQSHHLIAGPTVTPPSTAIALHTRAG